MSEIIPYGFSEGQFMFILEQLAIGKDPLDIQTRYDRYYSPDKLSGAMLDNIRKNHKAEIVKLREDIFTNRIQDIPAAHSYILMAIANQRIEWLGTNKVVVGTYRETDASGKDYWAKDERIDDAELRKWCEFAQKERFFHVRLEIEKVIKDVDADIVATEFTPATINVPRLEASNEPQMD